MTLLTFVELMIAPKNTEFNMETETMKTTILDYADNYEATFVANHHIYTTVSLLKSNDKFVVSSMLEPVGFQSYQDVYCNQLDVAKRVFVDRCKRLNAI